MLKTVRSVLIYHSVGECPLKEDGAGIYCVSTDNFYKQMEYIAAQHALSHEPACVPLVTFDDGDITNYTQAFSVLKQFGIRAYFFVLPSKIGSEGFMDWQHIKELQKNGMLIGSHGMTHRILTGLDDTSLAYELRESKRIIENGLRERVDFLSIPRGFCDARVARLARAAGYKRVFTSCPGQDDGFLEGRLGVKADWDFNFFRDAIAGKMPLAYRVRRFIYNNAKKILGTDNYDRIRSVIVR